MNFLRTLFLSRPYSFNKAQNPHGLPDVNDPSINHEALRGNWWQRRKEILRLIDKAYPAICNEHWHGIFSNGLVCTECPASKIPV